jgi:hydrogenase-4 component B
MLLTLACIGSLLSFGLIAIVCGGRPRLAHWIGLSGAIVTSAFGLVAAIPTLVMGGRQALSMPWGGFGSLSFALDPLSALFLVPIWILGAVAALFGSEYVWTHRGNKALGVHWFFYNLLLGSMVAVVVAANVWAFLIGWELMALSSFLLVLFDHEKPRVRDAGWVYLIATHLGTALVIPVFFVLAQQAGSSEFEAMRVATKDPDTTGLLFVLALLGLGTKAGFAPLHVWLPEAHPAAPSHVSAVMSGVMIKTGIYALLRMIGILGTPPVWWGCVLIAVGVGSAVMGILFALAQHDAKRLLAYSSVENIGIIATGMGLGLLGVATGMEGLAVLGYAGALLHIVNHALFKGLLFLGAGAIDQQTHSRELDKLGGLLRRMPWTGVAFLVGAVAISGLPPLNGFVGELMLYLGALEASRSDSVTLGAAAVIAVGGLSLVGGLAAACFAKAFGIVFLGEPRTDRATHARDPGWAMRAALWTLGAACVIVGFGAPLLLPRLAKVLVGLTSLPDAVIATRLASAQSILISVLEVALAFGVILALCAFVRSRLLARRDVRTGVTWDCGYAAPAVRMQYTASSFAEPLTRAFSKVLRTWRASADPAGYFPEQASLATETPDLGRERIFGPAFVTIRETLGRVRWMQRGDVHRYVLYIAAALVVLLIWKL